MNIHDMRLNYMKSSLELKDTDADAVLQFKKWFQEIVDVHPEEANAMTLATCHENIPSARVVLLKEVSADGFVFYTNYLSDKGKDLDKNPVASLVFFWASLERQVRIYGSVKKISAQESDEYFYSRPRGSQIGAVVSPQSQVIDDKNILLNKYDEIENSSEPIRKPEHWGGYVVLPEKIEFWQGRPSRLHDRIIYTKDGDAWIKKVLAP